MHDIDGWEESEGWGTQSDDGATHLQIEFDPSQATLIIRIEAGTPNQLSTNDQVEEASSLRLIGPAAALFWGRLKKRLLPPSPPASDAPFAGLEDWPPEPM